MAWFHSLLPGFGKFHMVILASICWAIWNIRNRVTFDNSQMKSPSVFSFYSILFVGLFEITKDVVDKEKLLEGAHKLKQVAASVYTRQEHSDGSRRLAIVTMI
jgi:hypothetical protein